MPASSDFNRPEQIKLLMFDIDGTLLFSGGAGKLAMERCLMRFVSELQIVDIPVHGRTDKAIIADLLNAHSLSATDQIIADFYEAYLVELDRTIHECQPRLLPGVRELLSSLVEHVGVEMGILTGNGRVATEIKLNYFGLLNFFKFGGYGESTDDRRQVARNALQDAQRTLQLSPPECSPWVIGDTVHDVACARAINAKVIAVGTGKVCHDELRQSRPDVFLKDLSCISSFLSAIECAT
ncbi:MAG TPA: HAD family hydrolase [Pirellulaceae bacterium]|nr:HAD family hydrolase [Pirellulaceae bacterium]HMO91468.1 HAD family hydrolase [Pirellulaceae bacterium]HMP69455.1 HAD family hydrolase [Pirellulaceae bacterium]